jgi:hypothetical protein
MESKNLREAELPLPQAAAHYHYRYRELHGRHSTTAMAPTSTKRTKRSIDSLATAATSAAAPSSSTSTSATASASASASASTAPPFAAVTKRRVVNLADDADAVLAKCRKLRDELRRKQALQTTNINDEGVDDADSSDLEWGMGGDGKRVGKQQQQQQTGNVISGAAKAATVDDANAEDDTKKTKTQQLSLSELRNMASANNGKKTIVEVVEMNSTEVMEGIENVAVHIAHQVLAKQGFQLAIPCRCYHVCERRTSMYLI